MDRVISKGRRRAIGAADYRTLAAFRHALRRFMAFSEDAARDAGLTAQQHQAILAIKGHKGGGPLTIGELALTLLVKHHSAVELVDRLSKAGFVARAQAEGDRRSVLLALTPKAEAILEKLSAIHLEELSRSRIFITQLLERLDVS